jgi:hypothetical protein
MKELRGKQGQVVGLLLGGMTQREAAATAGVAEETVSRWRRKDEGFRRALEEGRGELQAANRERLESMTGLALRTLEGLMREGSEGTRMRAALEVLRATMTPAARDGLGDRAFWQALAEANARDGEVWER